jgi:hypothetical protein
LISLLGRSGGIGERAIAISAISEVFPTSSSCVSATATMGITTSIASSDRSSRPGRRHKYKRSVAVDINPRLNTMQTMLN